MIWARIMFRRDNPMPLTDTAERIGIFISFHSFSTDGKSCHLKFGVTCLESRSSQVTSLVPSLRLG